MPDPTDIGERAVSAAQTFLRRSQEIAKRESRVIRLQAQMSKLKAQRRQTLVQMGEKVFDLFQRDLVKNQDLRMMCQQIRGVDAELDIKREEIERLRRPSDRSEDGIDQDLTPVPEILEDDDEIIQG